MVPFFSSFWLVYSLFAVIVAGLEQKWKDIMRHNHLSCDSQTNTMSFSVSVCFFTFLSSLLLFLLFFSWVCVFLYCVYNFSHFQCETITQIPSTRFIFIYYFIILIANMKHLQYKSLGQKRNSIWTQHQNQLNVMRDLATVNMYTNVYSDLEVYIMFGPQIQPINQSQQKHSTWIYYLSAYEMFKAMSNSD